MKNQEFITNLIAALDQIPEEFKLIPVDGNKSPELWKGWRKGFDREFIKKEIKSGRAKGFGLLTGPISGGLLATDCDGDAAHKLKEEIGGLPHTVSWTSGSPGRAQYLTRIPEEYWGAIATKKIKTGVVENGKEVLLELRWDGCQSVMPFSLHPSGNLYQWINDLTTPIAETPIYFIERMLVVPENKNPDQLPLNFNNNDNLITPIPLYNCLSKEDRKLIDSGVSEGGRNDSGAKLARNLIGTAQRLNYLGYQFDGNPEDLFNDYCDRCQPSINNKERQSIWRSAEKDNPTATLTDDFIENCVKTWQRNQQRQQNPLINTLKPSYKISENAALKPEPEQELNNVIPFRQAQIDIESIDDELRNLAEQNLSKSKLQLKLNGIAKRGNISPKEVQEIYKNILNEIEEKSSIDDIKSELDELIKNKNQSLNLSEYLPGNLTKVTEFANRLCLRPEMALTAFLSVVSSLQNVQTQIDVLDYTEFDQPLILFNAICAEPSQKKSPLINKIALEPLRVLQEEARAKYEQEMAEYQVDYAEWSSVKNNPDPEPEKPVMRRYYINSASQAGLRNLLNTQSKNNWGTLILCDELAGNFKNSSKTYNVGMVEDILSYYDGSGKIEALKDGFAGDFDKCLISILGGIQPEVIASFNNGSDGNGQWSRFNFLNQPTTAFIIPDNPPAKLNVKNLLTDFYRKLSNVPQLSLRLSPEAEKLFIKLNNRCENYRVTAKSQGLAAQWGKAPGKIGRFAALIHIVEQVALYGTVKDFVISKATLTKGANLAKFYFNESQNLYASCTKDDLPKTLENILTVAEEAGKAITSRDVQRHKLFRTKDFQGLKSPDIQKLFMQLAEMGYGSIVGSGVKIQFQILSQLSPFVTSDCDKPKSIQDSSSSHLSQLSQEKIKNFETQPEFSMGTDTQPMDEPQNTDTQEEPVTVVTKPQTVDTEPVMGCHEGGDSPVTLVTNSEPTPEPELIPVKFDDLKAGDVLFDRKGQPHQLTKRNIQQWETHKSGYISRNDIRTGEYHHATVRDIEGMNIEEITALIRQIINGKNKTLAKWMDENFGNNLDTVMNQAIQENLEEFAEFLNYPNW